MTSEPANSSGSRRALGLGAFGLGALLLLSVPVALLVLSFSDASNVNIPGTLVILSATAGMALVAVGAALNNA